MSLRTKIALALFSAVVLFAGVDLLLRQAGFAKRFDGLDEARALEQIGRFERSLEAFQGRLAALAGGQSAEPGQATVTGPARDARDLEGALDTEVRVHFAAVYTEPGDMLASETRANERGEQAYEPELELLGRIILTPAVSGTPGHAFRMDLDEVGRAVGVWQLQTGVALLGGAKVPGPDGTKLYSIRGCLIDPALIRQLQDESYTRTTLVEAISGNVDVQDRVEELVDASELQLTWSRNGVREVARLFRGVKGSPALLAQLEVPIELQQELRGLWSDLRQDSLFSAVALALLFPLVILMLLQAIVTGPLTRLTRHAAAIGSADGTELRLGLKRRDEIGQLANEFDLMLEKLSASREEVIRTARVAGIAEISAGVMHNVGNSLNSVHVSAALVRERLAALRPEGLRIVLEELESHRGSLDEYMDTDPKGQRLLKLFRGLIDNADECVESSRAESAELVSGLERLAAMVYSLQAAHRRQDLVGEVRLSAVVEEALDLCAQSTGRCDVVPKRDYEVDPLVELDRHKLSQALCHVLQNAFEHLDPSREAEIGVRIAEGPDGAWRIEIHDNGCGIEADRLGTLFQPGSSTKTGSSGLGLHLAATAAGELGGELRVDSPGVGQGTTMTVSLPRSEERRVA